MPMSNACQCINQSDGTCVCKWRKQLIIISEHVFIFTEFNETVLEPEKGDWTWWKPENGQNSRESSGWNHSVSDCHRGAMLPEDHSHTVGCSLCWQWRTEGATYLLLSDQVAVSLKSTLSFGLSKWKKALPMVASVWKAQQIKEWMMDWWVAGWTEITLRDG